jgi:sialate O-acetylesterase
LVRVDNTDNGRRLSVVDYFSATCYFFGRELYKSLGIPIGLIVSCWGGQQVETFSSPDALADETCGGIQPTLNDDDIQYDFFDEGLSSVNYDDYYYNYDDYGYDYDPFYFRAKVQPQPTQLWNAMIHPLINMRLTGVVWYQGEANANNPASYACRFPAMSKQLRFVNVFGCV